MNADERLAAMMSRVGEIPSEENRWEEFAPRARRSLYLHRAMAIAASVAIGAAVAAGAFLALRDSSVPEPDLPPVDRQVVPVPIPEEVRATCPAAPEVVSGDRGTVAYLGATELHVVDLESGDDAILVQGGDGFGEGVFQGDIRMSSDARWIAFGDGLLVPTEGGEICAPLGRGVRDLQWTPDGRLVGQSEEGLYVGDPDRPGEPGLISLENMAIASYAVSPDGTQVAVDVLTVADSPEGVTDAGVWTIDLETEEVTRLVDFAVDPLTEVPEIAGWSPDGEWVLFWTQNLGKENSISVGGPLSAVEVATASVFRVADAMPAERSQIAPCGPGVVFAEGPSGLPAKELRLALSAPPAWDPVVFPAEPGLSYSFPSCTPTSGSIVATTYPPGGPEGALVVFDEPGAPSRPVGDTPLTSYQRPLAISEGGILYERHSLRGGETDLVYLSTGFEALDDAELTWALGSSPDLSLGDGGVPRHWDWRP